MQRPNQRKRQRSKHHSPQVNGSMQPLLKKQQLNHSQHKLDYPHFELNHTNSETRSRTPAAFYDNLSKVWLTRHALRELDRRNAQPAPTSPCPPHRQTYSPFTQYALTKVETHSPTTQSPSDFLHHCLLRYLKDIKRLARHGGPSLLELRGYPAFIDPLDYVMDSIRSNSQGRGQGRGRVRGRSQGQGQGQGRGQGRASTSSSRTQTTASAPTTTTENTKPYHYNFQQNLMDHGIYPEGFEFYDGRVPPIPNNWEEINQKLTHSRASLSPSRFSDRAFKRFKFADAHASKESEVGETVIPFIEGDIRDGSCTLGGIPFNNLDPLTNGTLAPGNPDVYHGACTLQLSQQIRNHLRGTIIPSTQAELPMAPNFFLAANGPDGTAAVVRRQACYDGALGARGILSLQSYGLPEPIYDNNAYTITSIYSDGQLKLFTSHPSQPTGPGNKPEYFMTQLNTWAMTGDLDTFLKGATAYRNARDWAKEKRDEIIEAANGRMPNMCAESPFLGSSSHQQASLQEQQDSSQLNRF